MSSHAESMPLLVPMLARGKHRNPRQGACFMELASYLAGERWSDHPSCTSPLLAAVARHVNDFTSDAARPGLAGLIPAVIGVTTDDPRVDVRVALRCATTALPVVAAERQRVMAVAILSCERVLAQLDGRPVSLKPQSRRALAQVPHAAQWAERFASDVRTPVKTFRRTAAPSIVRGAIEGIGTACVGNADGLLHDLLVAVIEEFPASTPLGPQTALDSPAWQRACQLAGVATG